MKFVSTVDEDIYSKNHVATRKNRLALKMDLQGFMDRTGMQTVKPIAKNV